MSILRVHRLATAALLSLILSSSARAKDVYIAVAGPMTGSTASLGAQIRDGAAAAVDSINESGLLPDTKLILRIVDDACDPKQAVAVANRLITDGIKLVVGHICSSSSIPASDISAEAEVLQISPGSTNPRLTEHGLITLFRICGRDDQQGRVAADYIVRHHQGAKLAVLDDKSTAGKGIADIVESRLRAAGAYTVRQRYVAGEKDYTALVSRLKREGIQIVYIGGYYNEIGLIVRQAAEAGARLTVVANDPLMTSDFLAVAGEAANDTLFTFMPDPTKNAAGQQLSPGLRVRTYLPRVTRSTLMPRFKHGQTPSNGPAASMPLGSLRPYARAQSKRPLARFDSTLRETIPLLASSSTAGATIPSMRSSRTDRPSQHRTERSNDEPSSI
ncbi:branched-chain amino acid ABC transporter substrate-binding protein [Bradyrhizobium sp. NDS-1]|uniref:branched-chain amino acid ABC transporter substrate-binding protein n=1 Tax=Bradyrhizobium sp. NDS-1 TaxID=3080014 RepID=UPI00293EE9D6|nr:branched-chain amino acid ABC transporter substrate-binding protein [Bradyrhizobium sp. NDS-1]WOH75688.1 branched-chain amino acid ABC transporter substrate-binding protein [Bradyrhizobium sp. NDS-1]